MANFTVPITSAERSDRRHTAWFIDDIYSGPTGKGQYVPMIDDMVWSWEEGILRVMNVDDVTNLSTLVPYNLATMNGGAQIQDVLLGIGQGVATAAHRVYINTSVVPHVMAFDHRLRLYGSRASYVKVFYNHNTTSAGHVVSAMYNSSNVAISENIPLELVMMNNTTNHAVKTPTLAWCNETIPNNETLTAVFYATDGAVLGSCPLIVKHSNFVRTVDQSAKYITSIDLVSPYLSDTDNRLLEYPVNMLVQSGSLIGRVHYSDGSAPIELPIDGTKFSLHGIENYVASRPDSVVNLVLTYKMSADEYAYSTNAPTPDRTITRNYRLKTVEAVNRYSVKLFAIPTWTGGSVNRWSLNYYLYDLDRSVIHEVTPFVENMVSATPFNGQLYGTQQDIAVAINLDNLGASYQWYRHPQTFAITLHQTGNVTAPTSFFSLEYSNTMKYGHELFAKARTVTVANTTTYTLNIANGATSNIDWLNKHYWPLEPLVYHAAESNAPNPTHVRVKIGSSFTRELSIAEALLDITNITTPITSGTTVRLEFIRRTTSRDQELAMGSLNVKM